ncbi:DivIVA domain-containing protein [Micromonospora gifhornensis]|uniref:DivIVA domain-containing protein n=1 Tax=Micromonospora gifhornensis TaxID=84594 RepID=A0ABQ4IG55_9ACTN|nr:DivIVA domain-containing protein [Micromonospora gifhornensis]GIJ16889.1 hypothetical protein Vgi01_35730 [Micromonospora gifhornensis]
MDVRQKRAPLLLAGVLFLFGLSVLVLADEPSLLAVVGGVLFVAFNGWRLVTAVVRPFRFRIDADGLDVRVTGLRRTLAWHEIDAIVLCRPAATGPAPWLLLVPAAGVLDRPLTEPSPVDGRKGLLLLDLGTVRQSVDEVTAALIRFGGGRFVDGRQHRRPASEPPSFTTSLRGYDRRQIDELVGQGLEAFASGVPAQRSAVRARIDSARTDLAVSLRGYDIAEVDAYLDRLSADLADEPGPRAG